jgi:predicted RNase H-like HicB family nuclease
MKKDYHINSFYGEDDEAYIADIPDFEMCSAFGATPVEALQQVLIAKVGIIETMREKVCQFLNRVVVQLFTRSRKVVSVHDQPHSSETV